MAVARVKTLDSCQSVNQPRVSTGSPRPVRYSRLPPLAAVSHHKDHHLIFGKPKRRELLGVQLMRLGVDVDTPGNPSEVAM